MAEISGSIEISRPQASWREAEKMGSGGNCRTISMSGDGAWAGAYAKYRLEQPKRVALKRRAVWLESVAALSSTQMTLALYRERVIRYIEWRA